MQLNILQWLHVSRQLVSTANKRRELVSSVDQASLDESPATVHRGRLWSQTLANHRQDQQCFLKTALEHTQGRVVNQTTHR